MATLEDLASINAVIASGARSVTLADTTVIYNTGDTLMKIRDDLIRQLNAAKPRRPRQTYLYQNGRGYD